MPRNFHVLPRNPVKIPMPPVKPTMGPRPTIGPHPRLYPERSIGETGSDFEPTWPFVLIGAAVVLLVLFGIFFA